MYIWLVRQIWAWRRHRHFHTRVHGIANVVPVLCIYFHFICVVGWSTVGYSNSLVVWVQQKMDKTISEGWVDENDNVFLTMREWEKNHGCLKKIIQTTN